MLGIEALAVVDRNSFAGIVRAHEAAKATRVRLIVGCRLDLADDLSVLVYPTDRAAYAHLCRLLSLGKKRAGKAKCHLTWEDVVAYGDGLIAIFLPDEADDLCALRLRRLREAFGDRGYMALTLRRRPNDQLRLHRLSNLATAMHVPTVVTNDVLFHDPARRIMQDVVTAIRHNVTIDELGFRRERHADRYLKSPQEMHRLFACYPEALGRTIAVAERCTFSLAELEYQYPEERTLPGLTAQQALEKLTWEGAAERYPEGLPDRVRATLDHELRLIATLDYAPYFLTVNSIVRFARSKGILCQGRGSAANSAVCYVLGITSIDPDRNDLLFERFVSQERKEPPDTYYAICLAEPVMRDIWSGTQVDKTLRELELADSRACADSLARVWSRLRPEANPAQLAATAFLIWQLGEAAMRLAISVDRAEGDRLVETYKRSPERIGERFAIARAGVVAPAILQGVTVLPSLSPCRA